MGSFRNLQFRRLIDSVYARDWSRRTVKRLLRTRPRAPDAFRPDVTAQSFQMTPCPGRRSEGCTHFTRSGVPCQTYFSMNARSFLINTLVYGNSGTKFQKMKRRAGLSVRAPVSIAKEAGVQRTVRPTNPGDLQTAAGR